MQPLLKPKRKKRKRPEFDTPPADKCQICGIEASPPYVFIERHHIKPVGMGGSWSKICYCDENRIDICNGPCSNGCHHKAQTYQEGYKPDDLRRIKEGE